MQNCNDSGGIFIHPCAARNNLEMKFQNMDIHRGAIMQEIVLILCAQKNNNDMFIGINR